MTTKVAFLKLISERGIYKRLELHRGRIGNMKNLIKSNDEYPSEDKMQELLEKAGYKIIQERKWEIKK